MRLDIPQPLLEKFDAAAPRYTSYPPIPYWRAMGPSQWGTWMAGDAGGAESSLSLYVHIPFCASRCYYCGCFVVITSKEDQGLRYAEAVKREMALVREHIAERGAVRQFHFGGGTPTFLSVDVLADLVETARSLYPFDTAPEMSIEVDPRTADRETLAALREAGFNRLSFGVQDFDETVQRTVNRVQPFEQVEGLMAAGRELGYRGINIDLIYGLPMQTPRSFDRTMDKVRRLAPDRIALYHYAHLPQSIPYQRRFDPATLPDKEAKLEIFLSARDRLTDWGYVAIGLDHFALADDGLAAALREGTLQRNFMGYTTRAGEETVAFGVSAISDYRGRYWQNEKKLNRYHQAISEGRVPIARGLRLSREDRLRKATVLGLFCGGRVDFADLSRRFGIDPRTHFAGELRDLAPLAAAGLVTLDDAGIGVTETGQFFLRNIAVVFDAYHAANDPAAPKFSRTV